MALPSWSVDTSDPVWYMQEYQIDPSDPGYRFEQIKATGNGDVGPVRSARSTMW